MQRLDEESSLRAYHGEGMGNAMHAIEAASRVKESYSQDWIVENAREALRAAAVHGNTHIRAFADVDSKARLEGVKALLQVKEEFRGVVELQVVAFPQDGVLREPGAADLVREAVASGRGRGRRHPLDRVHGCRGSRTRAADVRDRRGRRPARLHARGRRRRPRLAHAGDDGGERHRGRLAGTGAGPSRPRHGVVPRTVFSEAGRAPATGRHAGGHRSAHRPAPRPCARAPGRGCARLPGAGRHLRRLLPLRPQQHARSSVPGLRISCG